MPNCSRCGSRGHANIARMTDAALPTTPPRPSPTRPPRLRLQIHDDPGRIDAAAWDALLGRIPVVKSIYSSVKKVSESLLSDSRQSFKTPVLVPFPQPDIWTLAFVSGNIPDNIRQSLPEGGEYLSVYVPTTPNPTGGYYIMVRKSDVRTLDMSVDDALKYVISLGMVLPETPKHLQHSLFESMPSESSGNADEKPSDGLK